MSRIDRESPIPVYYQIQQDLLTRINNGEWQLNQMMPSETMLIADYDVSRVTIRQALAELEKDGVIKRYRGKGAFIKGVIPKPYVHVLNYRLVTTSDEKTDEDNIMTAEIITLERYNEPFPEILEALKLPEENKKIIYMKRLFFLGGKPISIGKSWLPDYLLPDFVEKGLISNSLTTTCRERYNLRPITVEDYLEVVRSTKSECDLLKCTADTPLLLVKGISSLEDGTPLEYAQNYWIGDNVRFKIQLRDTGEGFK